MKKYVADIEEDTGLCRTVGTQDELSAFYIEQGLEYKDVQESIQGLYYLTGYIIPEISAQFVRENLYKLNYDKKCQIAYNNIFFIKNNKKYMFLTDQNSIILINSTYNRLIQKADDYNIIWKTYSDDVPITIELTKSQFLQIYQFGMDMINTCFQVQGKYNQKITKLTNKQLNNLTTVQKIKKQMLEQYQNINITIQI